MFLLRWYKEYLEIKSDQADRKKELEFCASCESLKFQLALANDEKKQLLARLLDKPEAEPEPEIDRNLKPIMPAGIGLWKTRRQMLEREDRDRAKKAKENETRMAPSGGVSSSVAEIERELGVDSNAS